MECKYCKKIYDSTHECMWNEMQRNILDYVDFYFSFDGSDTYKDENEEIRII
jgi:hypothetical protein